MKEASPRGKVLPGHPVNQDQVLQSSRDSQALRLIPGGNRETRKGSGEGGGAPTSTLESGQVQFGVWRNVFNHVVFIPTFPEPK